LFQEIVFGPDIIDFIDENGYDSYVLKSKSYEMSKMLTDEIIILDKGRKLDEMMENRAFALGSDQALSWFEYLFSKFNIKRPYDHEELKSNNHLLPEDILEMGIAVQTKDKVWLKNKKSIDERKKYFREVTTRISPIKFDDYVFPEPYHRVIKDGVMWDCKKDYPFPFPKIFTPILRRAKTVEITDPYLMNDKNDIREKNLEALIKLCSSDCNINVITLGPYGYISRPSQPPEDVNINKLINNPGEPPMRIDWVNSRSKNKLTTLMNSIEKRGLKEAIVITKDYVIIDGHRRTTTCTELGYTQIPTYESTVNKSVLVWKKNLEEKYDNVTVELGKGPKQRWKIRERKMVTDEFFINLGHGLEAFRNGKTTQQTNISIHYRPNK